MRCEGPVALPFRANHECWVSTSHAQRWNSFRETKIHKQAKSAALPEMKPPQRPGSIHPAKMSLQICLGSVHLLCIVAHQTRVDSACCRAVGKQVHLFNSICTLFRFHHLALHIEAHAGESVLIKSSSREI